MKTIILNKNHTNLILAIMPLPREADTLDFTYGGVDFKVSAPAHVHDYNGVFAEVERMFYDYDITISSEAYNMVEVLERLIKDSNLEFYNTLSDKDKVKYMLSRGLKDTVNFMGKHSTFLSGMITVTVSAYLYSHYKKNTAYREAYEAKGFFGKLASDLPVAVSLASADLALLKCNELYNRSRLIAIDE